MSENGEIYTAGKNFTLPPALTAWTNSTSDISALTCHKSRAPEYHHILSHLIPAQVICKDEDDMRRILTS